MNTLMFPFAAKVIASQWEGCRFYSVSASHIMTKWTGEAERHVRALFQLAWLACCYN